MTESIWDAGLTQILEDSILFDFYGVLLTAKQQEIFHLYHEDNLSLSEISQELGMSRQGVHESVRKAMRSFHEFEEKLQLAEKLRKRSEAAEQILASVECVKDELRKLKNNIVLEELERIQTMILRLLDEAAD